MLGNVEISSPLIPTSTKS